MRDLRTISLTASGLSVFLFLPLLGCQRGCLSSWLANGLSNGGIMDDPKSGGGGGSLALPLALGAVDCPDGLARCVGGALETSRLARRPDPCTGSPEKCACPWDKVQTCPTGCAADGVTVVMAPELAPIQLCAPAPGDVFVRPLAPHPGGAASAPTLGAACGEERFRCIASTVMACSPVPPRPLGVCIKGCVVEGQGLDEDGVGDEAAMGILCVR